MTALGWLTCTGSVIALASLLGFALYILLGERAYQRGYQRGVLAGQHQAEMTRGWHPAVADSSWNAPEPPERRRSPDHQMTARDMPATFRSTGFYSQN